MISTPKYLILLGALLLPFLGYSQPPFNGLVVEEIPIPPAIAADIVAEHNADANVSGTSKEFGGLPRCWRVSACLSDQEFEIQAIIGFEAAPDIFPLELATTSGWFACWNKG
ncbi:MAG: hypothetical protein HRT74_01010 [Flavobacteriales bacterium]|nr:hypothetical protein [Flavobacteriales bacterium]